MLLELKNFNERSAAIDEMVELSASARFIQTEFKELGVEPPAWLELKIDSLRREIKTKNQDALAARLAELKARRETLKTVDEKRKSIDEEIAELQAKVL